MQVPLDRSTLQQSLEMRCLGSRAPSQAAAGAKPRPKARAERRAPQASDPWSSDTDFQEEEDEPPHASRTPARPAQPGTQYSALPPPPAQLPWAAGAGAAGARAVGAGPGAARPKTLAEQQEVTLTQPEPEPERQPQP